MFDRYPWMYSATAFNLSYADSGIFYIQASSDPSKVSNFYNLNMDHKFCNNFLLLYIKIIDSILAQ